MAEKKFSLLESIKMAIDLEKNGRKFYLKAAQKSKNESGKRVFKMLADEEILHLQTFEKMLEKAEKPENWKTLIKNFPSPRQVPVFNEKAPAEKITKNRTDELEALRMAMEQERNAINFFEQIIRKAKDENTRKIFEFVKDQEIYHYDLLQAEHDSITKTGFWFDMPEFRMDGKF